MVATLVDVEVGLYSSADTSCDDGVGNKFRNVVYIDRDVWVLER